MLTTVLLLLALLPQLVDRTKEPLQPPPPSPELSFEKRAAIYMARKMYREAIDVYGDALSQEPESAGLYNRLGIAYHHLNRLDDAKRCYRKAAKLDKRQAEAINNLGTVHFATRRYRRAIKAYKKALRYAPSSASIHSNLGTAYFSRKKFKKAVKEYWIALELDPEVFERRGTVGTLLQDRSVRDRAKYSYSLAQSYAGAGLYERALRYLRRALEEGIKREKVLRDAAFEPLWETAEFQLLVSNPPDSGLRQ